MSNDGKKYPTLEDVDPEAHRRIMAYCSTDEEGDLESEGNPNPFAEEPAAAPTESDAELDMDLLRQYADTVDARREAKAKDTALGKELKRMDPLIGDMCADVGVDKVTVSRGEAPSMNLRPYEYYTPKYPVDGKTSAVGLVEPDWDALADAAKDEDLEALLGALIQGPYAEFVSLALNGTGLGKKVREIIKDNERELKKQGRDGTDEEIFRMPPAFEGLVSVASKWRVSATTDS